MEEIPTEETPTTTTPATTTPTTTTPTSNQNEKDKEDEFEECLDEEPPRTTEVEDSAYQDAVTSDEKSASSSSGSTSTSEKKKTRQKYIPHPKAKYSDKTKLSHQRDLIDDETYREVLLTPQEREALKHLREADKELTSKYSDRFLMRFIFARKLNVEEALKMLKGHLDFRKMFKIDEPDNDDWGFELLRPGVSQWFPGLYDKKGRGVFYVQARYIFPEMMMSMTRYMRATYFIMDLVLDHDIQLQRKGFTMIEDLNGASLSTYLSMMRARSGDVDSPSMQTIMKLTQEALPIRLRGIYLMNAPWYYRVLVPLARPFLDPKLARHIQCVDPISVRQFFDEETVFEEYGGKFHPHWAQVMEDVTANRKTLSDGAYLDPTIRKIEH